MKPSKVIELLKTILLLDDMELKNCSLESVIEALEEEKINKEVSEKVNRNGAAST